MHALHTIGWMNVLVQLISMISFISGLFQLDPYKLVAFLILVTVNVFGLMCVKIRGTATPPLETPITFPTVTSKQERWELFDEINAWPLPQYPDCSSSGINTLPHTTWNVVCDQQLVCEQQQLCDSWRLCLCKLFRFSLMNTPNNVAFPADQELKIFPVPSGYCM